MKERRIKIILILLTIFMVLEFIVMPSANAKMTTVDSNWNKTDLYKGTVSNGVTQTTQNIVATIINVIRLVGTGIAIIMITYVAIKYMSAAPQEKAEFKKSAIAYVVGAIVLFAATNILTLIANFATTNISTT